MREKAHMGVLENERVASLARVYTGRSLIPPRFTDIKVPVLNAAESSQLLPKVTDLGVVEEAEPLEDLLAPENPANMEIDAQVSSESEQQLTIDEQTVIAQMLENLPAELTSEQRAKVEALLTHHRGILSAPCSDSLQTESEQTKELVLKWNELLVKDGLVYRQKTRLKEAGHAQPQLLLPRSEVNRAIELCHAGSVGGHFGIEKTIKQVERRFYWIGWKDDVRRYCRSCEQCTRYHRGKLPKHGALQPVLAGAPYERWYIDLTGPHPQSDRGNIWILTCMDSFTKWAEAFPLRRKEAESIARVMVEQLFTRFGPPLSILSDLGREVDGKIMNEVCKLFGIEKLRTTAYKPRTNQVERFHKTMNSILAKTVAENQRDWDARLPFAMAAYRATQHDSMGYLPNMLVLGRETRALPDIVYGAPMESSECDYDRFVEQTRDRAIQAYYEVRVSLQKQAQRNKKYYDLGLKGADFNTGD